jgi:very-short-patch-repair endonuclease
MTKKEDRVVGTVLEFIDKASELHGRLHAERFNQELFGNCIELGMESPIEQLFWIAVKSLCDAEYEGFNAGPVSADGGTALGPGIYLSPQARIGTYRVDFVMSRVPYSDAQGPDPLVVELDGHAFHDKDQRQRSYEKARDRYLVKQGYRVLHFTGSDVVADPFKVAHEAMSLLGVPLSSPEYDSSNPFGIE